MTIEPGKTYQDQWGKQWKILRGYSRLGAAPQFLGQRLGEKPGHTWTFGAQIIFNHEGKDITSADPRRAIVLQLTASA